jgi:hypothetical protein
VSGITFKSKSKPTDGHAVKSVTFKLHQDAAIPELLTAFESFMRGCGYSFEGHLEIVPDETFEYDDSDEVRDHPDVAKEKERASMAEKMIGRYQSQERPSLDRDTDSGAAAMEQAKIDHHEWEKLVRETSVKTMEQVMEEIEQLDTARTNDEEPEIDNNVNGG